MSRRRDVVPWEQQQVARRQDPFADMWGDWGDPFAGMGMMGGPLARRGGGGGGGGPFGGGGLFGMMDMMMADMMQGGMGGGGGGNMMRMGSMNNGGASGSFSCQSFSFSSSMGSDGQMHTEQFSSSTVADRGRGIHETQQAYSNSNSGVDKMSMERQMGEQGRKMVKERNRQSGEERQTSMLKGISEEQAGEFDARWQQEAAPHLQPHSRFSAQQMIAGGSAGGGRHGGYRQAATVPASSSGYSPYGQQQLQWQNAPTQQGYPQHGRSYGRY
eukprot:TRINITY_DN28104_c0_g1_i1.p1 TRINITY_DN28104_c0_g1~~TRINITY_DN28104_c0_g1_i1.p1  ORF type:complete len:272 (+),score=76.58 TRINITY_DN28104_c0_g1_i1:65-880(+)